MEPRHLKRLRLAAEAAMDEAHRIEHAAQRHFDPGYAAKITKAAIVDERRAWARYRAAFNRQIEANAA